MGSSHPELCKEAWESQGRVQKKNPKASGGARRPLKKRTAGESWAVGPPQIQGMLTLSSQLIRGSRQMISMEKTMKGEVVSLHQAHSPTPGIAPTLDFSNK